MQKRLRKFELGISLLALLSVVACGTGTAMVTAKNTTQPVMLGPVHQINNKKASLLAQKDEFDIGVEDSVSSQSTGRYSSRTTVIQEGEEKIDVELLKKVEGPADKIAVDKIYVGSSVSCILIFCSGRHDYAGIEGRIHGAQSAQGGAK